MKIYKALIPLIFLFFTANDIFAQNENRPWFFGLGLNAVDYQTTVPSDINTHYSAIRLSAGRNLWGNLNLEGSYTFNTISDHPGISGRELDHSAADIMLWYSFGDFLYRNDDGPIDPYLGAGAGISWLEHVNTGEDIQSNTLNATLGLNYWVNNRLAIYGQGAYKNSTDEFADTYFEYALGIRYIFSLQSSDVCFP